MYLDYHISVLKQKLHIYKNYIMSIAAAFLFNDIRSSSHYTVMIIKKPAILLFI